jgi:hypothetical protein
VPTIFWHSAGATKEGKLDNESLIRLKKAFKVYTKLVRAGIPSTEIYFVSSVNFGKPTLSEIMKTTLMEWGIGDHIFTANSSAHTFEDISNSFKLIKEHNLPQPIINVSSWYHIPRIWLMWFLLRKEFGYPKLKFAAAAARHFPWILKEPGKTIRMFRQAKQIKSRYL